MSGHRLAMDWARAANAGYFRTTDPGDGKTVTVANKMPMFWPITTGASDETRALSTPLSEGQLLFIVLDTDGGGDAVVTAASAIDQSANTIITFANAGDFIALYSVKIGSAYRWRVLATDGVTLS